MIHLWKGKSICYGGSFLRFKMMNAFTVKNYHVAVPKLHSSVVVVVATTTQLTELKIVHKDTVANVILH